MADQTWKTSLKQFHSKLRGSCHIASVLPALRSLLTDEEYSRVEDKEGNFGRVDELVTILLDKDELTFNGFCSALDENGYSLLSRMLKGRERTGSTIVVPLVPPQKENLTWKVVLQKNHKLRAGIHVASVLPALRPLLTEVEYSQIEDKASNIHRVDELLKVLLTKNESTFHTFCSVLETNGYADWSSKLKAEGAMHTETSIALDGSTDVSSIVTKLQRTKALVRSETVDCHHWAKSITDEIQTIVPKVFWLNLKQLCQRTTKECPIVGILVVGETGTGKSTFINNVVGQDVVEVGDSFESQTTAILKYSMNAKGLPVAFYDTPGLGDSRGVKDDEYLRKMEGILKSGAIHLVIYCIKLSETRMRDSLIRTFIEYHKIGVKWEHAVMALTFADCVPVPKHEKKKPDFEMGRYFNNRVVEMRDRITRVLVEQVGVKHEVASKIKCHPTADPDLVLLNGERWYVPFLQNILELLDVH